MYLGVIEWHSILIMMFLTLVFLIFAVTVNLASAFVERYEHRESGHHGLNLRTRTLQSESMFTQLIDNAHRYIRTWVIIPITTAKTSTISKKDESSSSSLQYEVDSYLEDSELLGVGDDGVSASQRVIHDIIHS